MNRNILFFDFQTGGHHLEYLFHISNNIDSFPEKNIYFFVDYNFEQSFLTQFNVKVNPRIKLYSITKEESIYYSKLSKIKKYFFSFKKIKLFLKLNDIQSVFFMDIYPILFFTAFVDLKVTLSGIYFIPILESANSLLNKIKSLILKMSITRNRWSRILILNNIEIIKVINHKYGVDLFENLSDPILNIKELKILNQDIPIHKYSDKISFLHIGTLDVRKGTLEILDSLYNFSKSELERFEIIIAGKASDSFVNTILEKLEKLNQLGINNVFFYPKSLSYFEFDYLLRNCNFVLLPYKLPQMSSGIFGHAINYKKPIIGNADGLMGRLIRKYDAGFCISSDSEAIAAIIEKFINYPLVINCNRYSEYLEINSPLNFVKKINSILC